MGDADAAWRASLAAVTIGDLMGGARTALDPRQATASREWLAVKVRHR